ncbi:hypothetical protein CDL12_12039 [Handroanthus impetiginosus]|uniref:Nucleotide-diphospho-sugar transferase domain-containing protein n=1 Tax=Handroanthus impetiginosus TaxID=429701 RepID=A0A2G9HCU2_9LAMI|nr:hypothetical protein CDL12_12039 [Handroanthus impetiginosus]
MDIDGESKLLSRKLPPEYGGAARYLINRNPNQYFLHHHLTNPNYPNHSYFHHLLKALILFTMVTLSSLVLYQASESPFQLLPRSISSSFSFSSHADDSSCGNSRNERLWLKQVLERSAMPDKTVIITTLNEAWIEPNSIFDLFLESFRIGNQTRWLLKHLLVVALDQHAFDHCLRLHRNCYFLTTEGIDFSGEAHFMTPDYLKMMWRRIDFLQSVLEIGYNFIFTDADIMWFRNPFPHFFRNTNFQISCDAFWGNPNDLKNGPNGGFNYVKSSNQTIEFYKFWYKSRELYPGNHDQDVLNKIKHHPFIKQIGLEIKFLDTAYFGGFCQPSKNLDLVCTMHANCCAGLDNKIHDLKILLQDWKNYRFLPRSVRKNRASSWSVPQRCGPASFGRHTPRKKNVEARR